MPTSSVQVSKVAFLGDYPPRHCGIATFTRDLRDAVAAVNPDWNCPVIAVSDQPGTYHYPDDVRFEIPQPDMPSYVRAANFLNLTPRNFESSGNSPAATFTMIVPPGGSSWTRRGALRRSRLFRRSTTRTGATSPAPPFNAFTPKSQADKTSIQGG